MCIHRRRAWLWLYWFGVLIAGCAQSGQPGSGTPPATLTLLSLTPPSPIAPTPTLRLLRTPNVLMVTLAPTPPPLLLSPPDCYETPPGGLWCLGQIQNGLLVPIEQVLIRVYLVTTDGTPLAERETPVARAYLLPGEMSPYGVMFDSVPNENAGPVAVLIRALESVRNYPALGAQLTKIESVGDLYRVVGTLANQGRYPARELELCVTLLDAKGRVTGFRTLRWAADNQLQSGEYLDFTVSITPLGRGSERFEVSAAGLLN